jgi:predicted component of viral defense system (DUF524 family)
MPRVAFSHWPRGSRELRISTLTGETIALDERAEYVFSFERALSSREELRLTELGGYMIRSDLAILSFRNFIGRTELAGVGIDVVSTKIGEGGVSRILQEVSELASSLVFGWSAPIGFEAVVDSSRRAPVAYHQLQFLRHTMLGQRPGQRLQDWLETIERNPTRRFAPERPVVSVDRVRRLDQIAVQSIFSRLDRLVPIAATASIVTNPLAVKLTFASPPRRHFPARVAAPRGRLSFDTIENRFTKHVIGECLSLVYRFVDHPRLHDGLKTDCRTMLGILEQAAAAPFLAEAGLISGFQAPSQALAKAEGYREVFGFWNDLTRHVSLPRTTVETTQLLEGRNIATLYEYWVFLKVLEAAVAVSGRIPLRRPEIRQDELGESIRLGLETALGPDITICFNPTFNRSSGAAYSTPLRPDVTLRVGNALHAFDAKYRLDRFDADEDDSDDDPATYKRADLYKMHTYRDAIADLRTAFVVYPGSEFVFFERAGTRRSDPKLIAIRDGVGAVPLRPSDNDPARSLRDLLRVFLTLPESPT